MGLPLLDQSLGSVGYRVPLFRIVPVQKDGPTAVAQVAQHRKRVRHLAHVMRVAGQDRLL
jgi:hypothetical protein